MKNTDGGIINKNVLVKNYVYYSYEEFGRGYIRCKTCKCLPEEDNYFGSYHDKTFKPSHKIIIETFNIRKEKLQAELELHKFYQVDKNPHFANKARQKTNGFYYAEKSLARIIHFSKKIIQEQQKIIYQKLAKKIEVGSINGKQQKFSKECPGEGWILGGIKTKEN